MSMVPGFYRNVLQSSPIADPEPPSLAKKTNALPVTWRSVSRHHLADWTLAFLPADAWKRTRCTKSEACRWRIGSPNSRS